MAKWIVHEKGAPTHGWELSVIDTEATQASHLMLSYGWDGLSKIIVWSSGGPCHLTCGESLAAKLRRVAQEHADELNNQPEGEAK